MPTTALAPDLVGEVRGPHTTELETHDSYSRGPQSVGFEGRRELPRDAGKAAQGVRIMTKMGARLGCPRVSARMSLGIKPLAQFERMRTRQQKFETCPRWGARSSNSRLDPNPPTIEFHRVLRACQRPKSIARIVLTCSINAGTSSVAVFHSSSRSTESYPCMSRSRMPAMSFHGISGCLLRVVGETRFTASPITAI